MERRTIKIGKFILSERKKERNVNGFRKKERKKERKRK